MPDPTLANWHDRIEALVTDVSIQLVDQFEAVVNFQYPRPERFRQMVIQELETHGYNAEFEKKSAPDLPTLIVRRR